ncbi:MAG: ATP-binding protein [Gammaproteobacteria bacterium]
MKLGAPASWSAWALGILGALPMLALAIVLLIGTGISQELRWAWLALAVIWLLAWTGFGISRHKRRLQLLSSLLQSLREGDYSLRARLKGESFREVWGEFNALAAQLGGEQRVGIETNALFSQLLAALDFAVLVINERDRLVDLNPAAEKLLGEVSTALIGRTANELALSDWLSRASPFTDSREFPGGSGPWEVRGLTFRRGGHPHRLLVVTDVSHTLREEERRTWRRLIRVLGHEINNSLGPIQSTANLLKEHAATTDPAMKEGLELIERRSQVLGAFIRRYAELVRLPPPNLETVELQVLIKHVVSIETRIEVQVESDARLTARADPTQLEQALINLLRNSADAALETGGGVRVRWRANGRYILIEVEDDGPGITHAENLFVPFFTTKPGGSGIGLVLARQIIEAHGGNLQLGNREDARGTLTRVRLPA